MGKRTPRQNTPPQDHQNKVKYIDLHLFNELRWLLDAATEWSIQDQLKLEESGYEVQVYAMDSAFLHARVLFEFFVTKTTNNHYGADEFLGRGIVLKSNSYETKWSGPLHAFLMHAQDRSRPVPLESSGVKKDLNQMPVDFAHEILRLWKEFEELLFQSSVPEHQELAKLARDKRQEAIKVAECVVNAPTAQQHATDKSQLLKPVFVFN
jgi:hypothetical protein